MNTSKILLLCILCISVILIFNNISKYFNKEFITNNLPNNNLVAMGNNNLLIPTSDQTYNPNDTNRPDNNLSHQETNISTSNSNTDIVNTDIDIPLVYSKDEISDTTIVRKQSPSRTPVIIDAGSGDINPDIEVNNTILNKFISLE